MFGCMDNAMTVPAFVSIIKQQNYLLKIWLVNITIKKLFPGQLYLNFCRFLLGTKLKKSLTLISFQTVHVVPWISRIHSWDELDVHEIFLEVYPIITRWISNKQHPLDRLIPSIKYSVYWWKSARHSCTVNHLMSNTNYLMNLTCLFS